MEIIRTFGAASIAQLLRAATLDGAASPGHIPDMADLINLRRARKARPRADREADAQAQRARHGETRPAKLARAAEAKRADAKLDQAQRQSKPDPKRDK
jgi:hypothetical protein